ncbi:SDR family NAD(P)-dependent oxidoreductase [Paenibacillus ginsengarvi]|uniref:SDR family NAD(P)-dependent oxidoreductase n=1 Tax=Paenibacillus ginsengarvi TaxID=400777 RepID=UPI001315181C|nr:SDR family NAD(P)-dependent oxidoreductase [Paenibacillus ginsengarvi]
MKGKVAVVTGGWRGIGRAVAVTLLEMGARVAVIDTDCKPPNIPCDEERLLVLEADIALGDQVKSSFDRIGRRFGGVDILVNCAGMTYRQPLIELEETFWDETMGVNLKGHYLCTREALPHMRARGGGSIVNVSSVRARLGFANDSCYIACKGGIESFTRALAVELAEYGVRVNCIAPGSIETDFNRDRLNAPGAREQAIAAIPLGRIGVPEDVVGTVLYLASDLSAYVTGVTIPVDGGLIIKG